MSQASQGCDRRIRHSDLGIRCMENPFRFQHTLGPWTDPWGLHLFGLPPSGGPDRL